MKVLDFGLAKMLETDRASSSLSMSPTIGVHATYAGVILGTASYMSPEQARGKALDQRTDIWSFGCVLFEMLTGRKTFDAGETVSDAVAAILTRDPDWTALPAGLPSGVRAALRRCLQKDPERRLHHIADARLELEEPGASLEILPAGAAPVRSMPLWLRGLPWAIAVLALAAAAGDALAARCPCHGAARGREARAGSAAWTRVVHRLDAFGRGVAGWPSHRVCRHSRRRTPGVLATARPVRRGRGPRQRERDLVSVLARRSFDCRGHGRRCPEGDFAG